MQLSKWLLCGTLSVLSILITIDADADAFYQDKTIRFIVGFSPGGGYDAYTRIIARHIGRHIPGNPDTIVQNMAGASSMLAANYIYQKAEPDGLTIGVWNSQLIFLEALGMPGVSFDSTRFGWVGAPVKGDPVCLFMGFSGIKTFIDALSSEKPVKMASSAAHGGTSTFVIPTLFNKILGANFHIVAGYKGSANMRLALQNREVDGVCLEWESVRASARTMLDAEGDDRLIPVVIQGNIPDPEVAHLPRIRDFIEDEQKRAWYDAWVTVQHFQRPLTVPPDTPAERLAMLRKAFDATMADPEFLADAGKSNLLIVPVSGAEAEQLAKTIMAMPDDVKQGMRSLMEN